jgi:Ca2+-binding EF-hand superfamily protein|tara:strand:+ start:55 stop:456 length:402 start_codon:yes stop_codon:yes gene_type:complete
MEKLRNSPAELLKNIEITNIEHEYLDRVFEFMIKQDETKPELYKKHISAMDVAKVLLHLGMHPTKSEVKLIIWEVDDDLDTYVSKAEFLNMYRRCISDTPNSELEPRKLYHLVQFLMYDSIDFKGRVTVEETL